jgi:hypothetical protein
VPPHVWVSVCDTTGELDGVCWVSMFSSRLLAVAATTASMAASNAALGGPACGVVSSVRNPDGRGTFNEGAKCRTACV